MSLIVVALDQLTKKIALHYSLSHKLSPVFSFCRINICWNRGISFSLCSSFYSWVIKIVVLSACILLINFWYKSRKNSEIFAYSLILGGGISNLMDRFWHGAVLDFIEIKLMDTVFPIFNLADISITVGVIVLLWKEFVYKK